MLRSQVIDQQADGTEENSYQREDGDARSLELSGDQQSDATTGEPSGESDEEDPPSVGDIGLTADGVEQQIRDSHKETEDRSVC